jgi:hypothetical protein
LLGIWEVGIGELGSAIEGRHINVQEEEAASIPG